VYVTDLAPHRPTVAIHYREAKVWDKAVRYLRDAGIEAYHRSAFRAAAVFFEDSLRALEYLPRTRATIQEALDLSLQARRVLTLLGEFSRIRDPLSVAQQLAGALEDRQSVAQIANSLSRYFWAIGDPDQALASGEQALSVAAELGDPMLEARARFSIGLVAHAIGDYGRAIEILGRNVGASQDLGSGPTRTVEVDLPRSILEDENMAWLAWCHAERGDFDVAVTIARATIHVAEVEDRPSLLVAGLFALGVAHLR